MHKTMFSIENFNFQNRQENPSWLVRISIWYGDRVQAGHQTAHLAAQPLPCALFSPDILAGGP